MARPTRPLVWHQLRFALPLAQDTAVGLVERLLADMARIKQNGILGQLLRDSWLAFTEGLL